MTQTTYKHDVCEICLKEDAVTTCPECGCRVRDEDCLEDGTCLDCAEKQGRIEE